MIQAETKELTSCLEAASTLKLNEWHHIAVTYDGAIGKTYIDGALVGSNPFSAKLLNSSAPLTIGQKNPAGGLLVPSFLGLIDEVRVWNRALTQEQIQSQSVLKLTGQEPGLVGYWNFDQAVTTDKSALGNHGQLMGQATIVRTVTPFPIPALTAGRFSFLQGYRFTLDGEADASYQLETSTNLLQWTPLITVKTTSSPLVFTDPSATNFPNFRFYLARQVP